MNTVNITTLAGILTALADRAATALQPPGRGAATAATLRQLAALGAAEAPVSFDTARTKRAVNSLTVERGPKGGAA